MVSEDTKQAEPLSPPPEKPAADIKKLTRQFNNVVRRAQAALVWERLWPRTLPVLGTGGLFLTTSWLGLWNALPPGGRMVGVITFATAAVASPLLMKTKSLIVTQKDALRRLDENLGDPTRPAQTLRDTISENQSIAAQDIWNMHLTQMWNKWGGKFEAGLPKPNIPARDPHKLRYAVVAAAALSALVAGEHREDRVMQAFNWAAPIVPLQVTAWVTPPESFQEKPLYLTQDTRNAEKDGRPLTAHKSSTMTILVLDNNAPVTINGKPLSLEKTTSKKNGDLVKTTYQYQTKLDQGNVTIKIGTGIEWNIAVSQDSAPTADIKSITTDPKESNSLVLEFTQKDDFGIQESTLEMKPLEQQEPGATPLPSGSLPEINLR